MLNARKIFLIVLVGLASAPAPAWAQLISDEYRLKAAFVSQFTQFVEWPTATWQEARTVQLCVVEPNPFGSELEQLVRGDSLNGRPLSVKEIFGADEVDGCHVLYVSAASGDASVLLKVTKGRPILTVGEADLFLESGGVIAMKNVDGRVRFEVSTVNAQKAGLQISSQLLSLALAVRGGLE